MMQLEAIRWLALVVLILFSGFTVYCTFKENFFKSLKTVLALHWGRQVTIDLFVGAFLFHFFVYLNEGSLLVTLLWLVPTIILGNLVTLLYVFVNFGSIVQHFV